MPGQTKDRLSGSQILILEDNLIVALELEHELIKYGANVTLCSTLAESLSAFQSLSCDFLLADYFLEGEVSLPLIEAAIARGVPYAVLTGYPAEDENPLVSEAKIFPKPFRARDIINHVADALGSARRATIPGKEGDPYRHAHGMEPE